MAGVLGEVHRQLGGRSPPGQLLQRAPHLALSCQVCGRAGALGACMLRFAECWAAG
jgi:hypothetical protein